MFMKPFLGMDITKNKNNTELNGLSFVTRKVSETQANLRDQMLSNAQSQHEKAKLPTPLRVMRWICMVFGLVLLSGIVRSVGGEDGITLRQAYENVPLLFWLCGGFMIGWAVLAFWGKKKERNITDSDETRQMLSRVEQAVQGSYAELGVPADAVNFDLLMFRYVVKKDQVVPTSFGPAAFMPCACKMFSENGNLCFADADQRYEIPLSAMQRITVVNKDGAIPSWNKNKPTNQPPYKDFKLRIDSYGFVHFKPYYILEFVHHGETWGIYFPNYELPAIESLTGLQPQE